MDSTTFCSYWYYTSVIEITWQKKNWTYVDAKANWNKHWLMYTVESSVSLAPNQNQLLFCCYFGVEHGVSCWSRGSSPHHDSQQKQGEASLHQAGLKVKHGFINKLDSFYFAILVQLTCFTETEKQTISQLAHTFLRNTFLRNITTMIINLFCPTFHLHHNTIRAAWYWKKLTLQYILFLRYILRREKI